MTSLLGAEQIGRALLALDTDDSKLIQGIDRAGVKAKKALEGHAAEFAKVGAVMTAAITGPLALFGSQALKAFQEQEKAMAGVHAALKSMGPVAGFNAKELARMADALQRTSNFSDEEILGKVTANLLRFGNITGDTFTRVQQAAVDMSARTGRELQSSLLLIAKAVNDPLQNLGALRRAGVELDESLIKSLATLGETAKARAMILDAIDRRFSGQAAAQAATTSGQIAQVSKSWDEFQETLGEVIVQVLPPLTAALKGLVGWLEELSPETKKWIVIAGGIAAAVGPAVMVLGGLAMGIGALIPVITAVGGAIIGLIAATGPIGLFIVAAGLLTAAWLKWGADIQLIMTDGFEVIALAVTRIKDFIVSAFTVIADKVTWPFRAMVQAAQNAYNLMVGHSIIPDMVIGIEGWLANLVASTDAHMGAMTASIAGAGEAQKASSFGVWNDIFSGFGEFSYEMLKANRVVSAGMAFINTLTGASEALKLPFPANLVAAAKVMATGMGFVSAIRSVSASKPSGLSMPSSSTSSITARPAEAGPAANAEQQQAQPSRTLTVQGLKPEDLWTGKMVRSLAEKMIEFQKYGGRVVLDG